MNLCVVPPPTTKSPIELRSSPSPKLTVDDDTYDDDDDDDDDDDE
jgi:hypothetical protein